MTPADKSFEAPIYDREGFLARFLNPDGLDRLITVTVDIIHRRNISDVWYNRLSCTAPMAQIRAQHEQEVHDRYSAIITCLSNLGEWNEHNEYYWNGVIQHIPDIVLWFASRTIKERVRHVMASFSNAYNIIGDVTAGTGETLGDVANWFEVMRDRGDIGSLEPGQLDILEAFSQIVDIRLLLPSRGSSCGVGVSQYEYLNSEFNKPWPSMIYDERGARANQFNDFCARLLMMSTEYFGDDIRNVPIEDIACLMMLSAGKEKSFFDKHHHHGEVITHDIEAHITNEVCFRQAASFWAKAHGRNLHFGLAIPPPLWKIMEDAGM